jgi:hypothetical protein
MAPTKAKATYAATTLSLLTKVTENSLVHVAARCNAQTSKRFRAEKVSAAVYPCHPGCEGSPATWLKKREINALKSP